MAQVNAEAEREAKRKTERDLYIKEFVDNALNQNIELRIRFAEYFAFLSTDEFRPGWKKYRRELMRRRDEARKTIDDMETQFREQVSRDPLDSKEIDRLERNLKWAHDEVGYFEKDRSALRNARTQTAAPKVDQNIAPGNYRVFVQFAGNLKREDVRSMMEDLRDTGWNVQGVRGGGERTGQAAGKSEVRYGNKQDLAAAQALALAALSSGLTSRALVPTQVSAIQKGTLEIWISR